MRFAARFNGPPGSANGGYAAGRLAAVLGDGPVEVTLRLPPPLERELGVEVDAAARAARLLDGEDVVAEARALDSLEVEVPQPRVSIDEARAAGAVTPLRDGHPFPTCFGCGFARPADDGLGCLSGPVEGRADGVWGVDWTPEEVAPELVWSALDCPSSAPVVEPGGAPHVLGRMAARIDRLPRAGESHAVMSWSAGADGRKKHAASALVDARGDVLAVALATWIALRPRL
jgi:hypothetical protein